MGDLHGFLQIAIAYAGIVAFGHCPVKEVDHPLFHDHPWIEHAFLLEFQVRSFEDNTFFLDLDHIFSIMTMCFTKATDGKQALGSNYKSAVGGLRFLYTMHHECCKIPARVGWTT